jgi:myosin heavy subunit
LRYLLPKKELDMAIKSDRLKKLEAELEDLMQWEKLGLVPKKDLQKHKEEISSIQTRMDEECERLKIMKETGEYEEYIAPKRNASKQAYAEPQTLPDMEIGMETDLGLDMETETFDVTEATTVGEEAEVHVDEEQAAEEEEEEDPFSDRNRWKRGVMEDPDADNW